MVYYNKKRQKKVRSSYYMFKKYGKRIGTFADSLIEEWLPKWSKKDNPLRLKRWGKKLGRTVDEYGYRRHIYNGRIRTYRRIGSRPSRYNTGRIGSNPRARPIGRNERGGANDHGQVGSRPF